MGIEEAFLNLYTDILGSEVQGRSHVNSLIVKQVKVVSSKDKVQLCRMFDITEVKEAMWQMSGNKASGPYGNNGI